MLLKGTTSLMAACGRRDLEMSIPIVQFLLERCEITSSPVAHLLGEGFLCSRLGLSRDTPTKNAASQPELLRLLVDAGAELDANVVVYAVEDWCDEIAEHLRELGKESAPEIDSTKSERAVDCDDDAKVFEISPRCEFGAGWVSQKVGNILSCEGGNDFGGGETKGDAAANEAASTLVSLGTSPFAAFSSKIAAVLQEVLDMGGDVNAADATGTKRDEMHSLDVWQHMSLMFTTLS